MATIKLEVKLPATVRLNSVELQILAQSMTWIVEHMGREVVPDELESDVHATLSLEV